MMDTKALRQKILDLAIHGKLVPQDPNDEPASVLLERIKAEKERLIKEGKIKRSKKSAKSSDTLCDEFMQGAIESGHRVEKVFLRDKTIHPCTGCGVCSQYKKPCPQKDDAAEIIGKMLAADVIVMATPVYFYAMSAQMKTLIDRCCGPYTEMKNKEFYFIATAAEEDNGIMDRIVANFMGFLDCLENPTVKGTLFCGGVWHVGEIEGNPTLRQAYEQGKRV